mmetsp:Transcript_29250/g.74390  ORF Transcript_29250/g.74390 Transcript_29250/m.74390 type:complete len:206 (+) Transcript_29250:1200-1817(+)
MLRAGLVLALGIEAALPRELADLEVRLLLPGLRHDAPEVEVHDSRSGADDGPDPPVEFLKGVLACGEAVPCWVPRILLTPSQGVREVVRGSQRHLCDRREVVAQLLFRPDEPVAPVVHGLLRPRVVRLQGGEDDEEGERGGAVTPSRDYARADLHRHRLVLGGDELLPKHVQESSWFSALDYIDDIKEAVLVVRRVARRLQNVGP